MPSPMPRHVAFVVPELVGWRTWSLVLQLAKFFVRTSGGKGSPLAGASLGRIASTRRAMLLVRRLAKLPISSLV